MVEQRTRFSSYDPNPDGFDGYFDDSSAQPTPYRFGQSTQDDYGHEPSVPLFLSDPEGEPYPEEFVTPLRKGRMASVSSKILLTVVAASGAAMLYAWFSSDATRDVLLSVKTSIAAVMPAPSATATAEAAQLTPTDLQVKPLPAKPPAPQGYTQDLTQGAAPIQPQAAAPAQTPPSPVVVATVTPSREEILNAYQSALQAHAPAAVAPAVSTPAPAASAPAPAPSPKRIDAQELATLMKRAKDMLAMGDIPAARLLLERAAEGQDATAALMLARTYDPAVLGTADVRNITPEPDKARAWYQKAAQLGSTEAQRRLAQLPN